MIAIYFRELVCDAPRASPSVSPPRALYII